MIQQAPKGEHLVGRCVFQYFGVAHECRFSEVHPEGDAAAQSQLGTQALIAPRKVNERERSCGCAAPGKNAITLDAEIERISN